MSIKSQKEAARQTTIAELRLIIKPGDTVTTTVTSVSPSGMSRTIKCQVISRGWDYKGNDKVANTEDALRIIDISHEVAEATGEKTAQNGSVRIAGCGMDMRFALVYNLGRALFPEGFALADGQYGRNGDKSGFDRDGGYALRYY